MTPLARIVSSAAQSLAVMNRLGLGPAKVNLTGSAIALGHPLGATGAIRSGTVVRALRRHRMRSGMVTKCVGTGQGLPVFLSGYDGVTMADILQHSEAGVLTLTINRPERKNADQRHVCSVGASTGAGSARCSHARCCYSGARGVFCAGNDIEEFSHQPPTDASSPVLRFLRAVATFPKSLLAAVCGPAVGIDTTTLLHCDLV